MGNWEILTTFVDKHCGELVLDSFEIVRLDGLHDEPDDDYYYLVSGRNGRVFVSCVGGLIPLKDYLPEDVYGKLEYVFNLNIDMWMLKTLEFENSI